MTPEQLAALLAQQEGQSLEFKLQYVLSGQGKDRNLDEVAKDIVALVNTAKDCAYLIIGAGDELKAGVRAAKTVKGEDYSAQRFLEIVNARVAPPITNLAYEEVEYAGSAYGVVSVAKSPHIHYLSRDLATPKRNFPKNSVLVRHGSGIELASPAEIHPARKSCVQLVDLSLEEKDSQYEMLDNRIVRVASDARRVFPMFDFKLRNSGDGDAVLHHLSLNVIEAAIDRTPVLGFRRYLDEECLEVRVENCGWGEAGCDVTFSEPLLDCLFPGRDRVAGKLASGGHMGLVYSAKDAQWNSLKRSPVRWARDALARLFGEPKHRVREITANWQCRGEDGALYKGKSPVEGENLPFARDDGIEFRVYLSRKGFVLEQTGGSFHADLSSGATYVTGVKLDPAGAQLLSYPVSRVIPAGGVDRFHVLVGATKSCTMKLKFTLAIDDYEVSSDTCSMQLWNPRNCAYHLRYHDGDDLQRELNRLQDGVRRWGGEDAVVLYEPFFEPCKRAINRFPLHD
ncbi:ATP-binding protein [Candidatus Woesearchaeota archaeon]|nr:ATP-binding protein [Candidatus Woesearchaeota archaeon]